MRIINFLLLLALVSCSTETVTLKLSETVTRDGLVYKKFDTTPLTAKIIEYYENGNLKIKGKFEKGYKTSTWHEFYISGNKKSSESFKEGKLNGVSTYYFQSGKVEKQFNYFQSNYHEEQKVFYESGQLKEMTKYNKGIVIGKPIRFTENGLQQFTLLANDYEQTSQKLAQFLKIKEQQKLFTGVVEVKSTKNNIDMLTLTFKDSVLNGPFTLYHPNGKVEQEGTNLNGKSHGEWKFYSEDGVLSSKATYKDDELYGPFTIYHLNGRVKKEGAYLNGKSHGEWKFYDENGVLTSKRTY